MAVYDREAELTLSRRSSLQVQPNANLHYSKLPTLSSFRLLRIALDPEDNSLICQMADYETHSCPPYVAVSYCWGAYGNFEACRVNGHEVKITTNLGGALRQICLDQRAGEEHVWADALCINQGDVAEKDVQIKHMPQIYARADRVLAWVSRGESERQALCRVQEFVRRGCEFPADTETAYLVYLALMRAFVSLSQVDYWRRIWVVQEVCLARTIEIVTLSARVAWDDFFEALARHIGVPGSRHLDIQGKLHEYMSTHTKHIAELNALRQRTRREASMPLLQALYWTRRCEATLIKDKIFALLGLVTDRWRPIQSLYYGDQLEHIERNITMIEMASSWSNDTALASNSTPAYRLDIITFSSITRNSSIHTSYPRWSPPWTDKDLWLRLRRWQLLRLDRVALDLNATAPLTTLPIRADNGALVVRGRSLGGIEHISSPSKRCAYKKPALLLAAARSVLDELQTRDRKATLDWQPRMRGSIAGGSGVGGSGTQKRLEPWKADLEKYRRRLGHMVEHLEAVVRNNDENEAPFTPSSIPTPTGPDHALYTAYRAQIYEMLTLGSSLSDASSVWDFQRMRFFRTPLGYLGFGLVQASPGDLVYLVRGLSVPVILRRYGSGLTANGFVVVGEMFVLGVLRGRCFLEESAEGGEEEEHGEKDGEGDGEGEMVVVRADAERGKEEELQIL